MPRSRRERRFTHLSCIARAARDEPRHMTPASRAKTPPTEGRRSGPIAKEIPRRAAQRIAKEIPRRAAQRELRGSLKSRQNSAPGGYGATCLRSSERHFQIWKSRG